MALIGTISGSNGTTTSAVTGSLIIAENPSVITPIKPSDVVLFVSGAATSVGAELPSIIFKGDSFVSGAFGTDSYVQMKPVNTLRVPTNQTASYIYTSGSTNDLYFTQYQPGTGFTNTTRLRWLEGVLTSGLLHGGILSTVNGTTTFSVTSGSGMIVVPNATTGVDPYPTIQYVEWNQFTSSSLIYSGTAQVTFVAIDSSGSLEQMNTAPTLRDYKNKIILGRVLHQTGSVTNGVANAPAMSFSAAANIFDFVRPFGPLKVSGHVLAASGSTLSLTKTAGDSYSEGRNYAFDPSNPNTILAADDPDVTVSKIYYQYVSGSSTITNTGTGLAGFTVIDPAQYNNNGTLDAVGNSEWTNQRVYWFPRAVNRALFVYYGSRKYGTLLEAVAGINVENFIEGANTKDSAIFVGTISVKGNESSLTNATAQISQAGLFRGANSGGGGGGGSTPPAGLDSYVQFNDGGTLFGGDAGFTYNKSTDSITVAGNITGSRITSTATGDLTTGGGQVYLNGASSNRIDFSSQGTGDPAFNAPTAGTKVVLYPAAGASATDYALGISPATLWQSIPSADAGMMFKWFGGTTTLAALSGSGNMEISGDLAVNGGDLTTSATTFNLVDTTATTVNFARAATDITAGAVGGSATFQGNITGSNVLLSGDLAVNGGDITSTAGTVNMFATAPVTLNFGATASVTTINLSRTSNTSTTSIGGGNNTVIGAVKTVNIGSGTGPSAICNVNIGSSGALGRTTMQQDVALTTGNLIGAPGSGANVMTLISSGNIIAKIDTDNNAAGHRFAIQDYRNIDQFSVGENGNAELSGSLFATGSITTSGTLRSDNSIGDEGGEIFLNRSITNTVLTGGLTIDVYQNRLRFFEEGGTNRGYFIDISEGGASASKNLVFTGSTNTFTSTSGSPFTLPIPPECGIIEIETCGGGGGGGSGGKLPSGNPSFGGGGGGGGGYSFISLRASTARALSSNLTITIGASGSGGPAITVDGTTGSAGTAGLATSVAAGATVLLFAPGGPGGAGGTTSTGTGGTAVSWKDAGGTGANSSASAKPNRPLIAGFAGGGAAGGGVDGGGTPRDGGDGGTGGDVRVDGVNRAGNGGTAAARNGVDATTSATYSPTGGGGGGGGAGRNGPVSGPGVAGSGGRGVQGSGGGGGGGNFNGAGNNSGAGGNGGEGWCIVRFI